STSPRRSSSSSCALRASPGASSRRRSSCTTCGTTERPAAPGRWTRMRRGCGGSCATRDRRSPSSRTSGVSGTGCWGCCRSSSVDDMSSDASREERAELLRSYHRAPPILVLPNAWDVASARALAALPGCRALATTSGGVARAIGFEDGERTPAEEMLRVAGRVAAAVDVAVTADLERGYGDPVGTARAAWEAGVVGMNLEDSTGGELVSIEDQVAAIRAVKEAVPALVLNARVDVYLRGRGGIPEAAGRANAYLA